MAHLNGGILKAKVSDDAHTEGSYAAMMGYDDLRDGAHAYGITSHAVVRLVLCGGLECRSLNTYIYTMHNAYALLLSYSLGKGYQSLIVSLMHIGEARTGGEIFPAKRMLGEEVDMVGNNHQVSNLKTVIHTSGSVRYEECLDAKLVHYSDGECYLLHGVAFIEMETPLHGHDILIPKLTEDEFAGMAFNGGYGEVRYLLIRELVLIGYL